MDKSYRFFPLWLIGLFLLLLLVRAGGYAQQVVINEACSANLYTMVDEDNDAGDWIELYNSGPDTLSLQGYFLSDKRSNSRMWEIPHVTLLPDAFALFFASKKNRREVVDHWETAVYCDSLWRYLNPDYEPEPCWEALAFVDTTWNEGYGGFGFGDNDDYTVTNDTLRTIYLRKSFFIEDTSKVLNAILHVDYDDGFVAYLNGHEVVRENMEPNGKRPHYRKSAMFPKEAQMYQGGSPGMFVINKSWLRRYLRNGENILAIQGHNRWSDNDMTLKPWLSFAIADTSHLFGPVPEWFFAQALPLHTNFSIKSSGEKLYLFSPQEELLDELAVGPLQTDNSFGRKVDGADTLVFFFHPTPGYSNNGAVSADSAIVDLPLIVPQTGYYEDSVLVAMRAPDTSFTIRYSLDGSLPTPEHPAYEEPLLLDSTTVVRARLFAPGYMPSKAATETLFINDSSTFRVASIATDPYYLWDEEEGVYVLGNQYLPDVPYFGANFWRNVEIPVNLDLYDPVSGHRFTQDCGLKIHGGYSRSIPQKSVRLLAKGRYGKRYFEEKLFADKPWERYKRFVLRNAGNDHFACFFRDAFFHQLVKHEARVDRLAYEPMLVYINGAYWGIQNMREKIDRYYLEANYGVDPERVDILTEQGEVISGDNADFLNLINFVQQHDLSQDTNFQRVEEEVNIASFTDLMAINIFVVNTDWPHNNMKWWREQGGRWNYFLLDLDATSSLFSYNGPSKRQLERVVYDSLTMNALLFREMLRNTDYRDAFISRYADLMNYTFRYERMDTLISCFLEKLRPEMERHKRRWGLQSVTVWENFYVNMQFRGFLLNRHAYARDYLVEFFDLEGGVSLHLASEPPGAGHLHINTIYPEYMPFDGVYFNPVPVTLEALPAPGFEFSHWENSDGLWSSQERIYRGIFSKDDTLTAVYRGAPDTAKVVFSEIMYAPYPQVACGEWLEICSLDEEAVDLFGWRVQVRDHLYAPLAEGVQLSPGGFLVLAADTAAFYAVYDRAIPAVELPGLSLPEGPSSLSLLDQYRNPIVSFSYGVSSPWPEEASFTGRSIELSEVTLDPDVPEHWINGCLGGSPGTPPHECNDSPSLFFTEYNCKSCDCYDAGDWVELYNNDSVVVDMTGWLFRDAKDDHAFLFPEGYQLAPGAYAVIARDSLKFKALYPEVEVLTPFDFGLGKEDSLLLFNRYGEEIASLGYHGDSLWPDGVYGTGRTAELRWPYTSPSSPSSWENGCYGGTPMRGPASCADNPDLIVTEIQYYPHEAYDGGSYFELFNRDTFAVDLQHWGVLNRDSLVNVVINDMLFLSPGGYLVFALDPSRFRAVYPEAPLFDESTGIALSPQPDSFGLCDPFGVTRLWMRYEVSPPWPEVLSSDGKVIELLDYDRSYREPENWFEGCKEGSPGHAYRLCDSTAIGDYSRGYRVSPNPFGDHFEVYTGEGNPIHRIRLLNTHGQCVYHKGFGVGEIRAFVAVGMLPAGLYLLEVSTSRGLFHTPILKR